MTRDDNITWGETADELDRLRAELSEERHAHNKTQFDLATARKERAMLMRQLSKQANTGARAMTTEPTQADRDAAADWCMSQPFPSKQVEGPIIRAGEDDHHSLVQAFAAHRIAGTAALQARVETLEAALREMFEAVCGETGFAQAVRADSGFAYPWPALDMAEVKARKALGGNDA